MESNKIKNVLPFNAFRFINCYYMGLMSAVSAFGVRCESILPYFAKIAGKNFSTTNLSGVKEKNLGKVFGYSIKNFVLSEKSVREAVDGGSPVLAAADCFFLPYREETYLKEHSPHFLIIIGYDNILGTLSIIDADFNNSNMNVEKTVPVADVFAANDGFIRHLAKKNTSARIICKIAPMKRENKLFDKKASKKIARATIFAGENISKLEAEMFGGENFKKVINDRIKYLQILRTTLYCFINSDIFSEDEKGKTEELVSGYSNIITFLFKMRTKRDYGYAAQNKEFIQSKFDEIKKLQAEIYNLWAVKCV